MSNESAANLQIVHSLKIDCHKDTPLLRYGFANPYLNNGDFQGKGLNLMALVLRLRAFWHMIEGKEKSYAYDTAARAEPENRNQAKSSSSGCLALLRKVTPPFAP